MLKLRLPVSCLAFLTSSFSSSSSNEAVRDALSASKVLHLLARIFRFHFDCTDGSRSLSPPPPSLPPRQSSSPLPPISFSSPQSLQCLGRATSSDVPSSSSSRKDMDQSEEHGKEEEREVLFLRTSSERSFNTRQPYHHHHHRHQRLCPLSSFFSPLDNLHSSPSLPPRLPWSRDVLNVQTPYVQCLDEDSEEAQPRVEDDSPEESFLMHLDRNLRRKKGRRKSPSSSSPTRFSCPVALSSLPRTPPPPLCSSVSTDAHDASSFSFSLPRADSSTSHTAALYSRDTPPTPLPQAPSSYRSSRREEAALLYTALPPSRSPSLSSSASSLSRSKSWLTFLIPTASLSLSVPVLLLVGFSPFFCMLLFILGLHSVLLAMLIMHWLCMTTVPLLYIYLFEHSFEYYRHVWSIQRCRFRKQCWWGICFCLGTLVGLYGVYYLSAFPYVIVEGWEWTWLRQLLEQVRQNCLHRGLNLPFPLLVVSGIYFFLVNPLIEEWFWRVFLYREFGGAVFVAVPNGVLHMKESDPLMLLSCCPLRRHHETAGHVAAVSIPLDATDLSPEPTMPIAPLAALPCQHAGGTAVEEDRPHQQEARLALSSRPNGLAQEGLGGRGQRQQGPGKRLLLLQSSPEKALHPEEGVDPSSSCASTGPLEKKTKQTHAPPPPPPPLFPHDRHPEETRVGGSELRSISNTLTTHPVSPAKEEREEGKETPGLDVVSPSYHLTKDTRPPAICQEAAHSSCPPTSPSARSAKKPNDLPPPTTLLSGTKTSATDSTPAFSSSSQAPSQHAVDNSLLKSPAPSSTAPEDKEDATLLLHPPPHSQRRHPPPPPPRLLLPNTPDALQHANEESGEKLPSREEEENLPYLSPSRASGQVRFSPASSPYASSSECFYSLSSPTQHPPPPQDLFASLSSSSSSSPPSKSSLGLSPARTRQEEFEEGVPVGDIIQTRECREKRESERGVSRKLTFEQVGLPEEKKEVLGDSSRIPAGSSSAPLPRLTSGKSTSQGSSCAAGSVFVLAKAPTRSSSGSPEDGRGAEGGGHEKSSPESLEEGGGEEEADYCPPPSAPVVTRVAPGVLQVDVELSLLGKILLSFFYASYHSVVFGTLIGLVYGFAAIPLITLLGLLLIYLRNTTRFGILSAVLLHVGVDAAAVAVLGSILGYY